MVKAMQGIKWLLKNEKGGESVEYPSTVAAVLVVGIPTLIAIGVAVGVLLTRINTQIGTI